MAERFGKGRYILRFYSVVYAGADSVADITSDSDFPVAGTYGYSHEHNRNNDCVYSITHNLELVRLPI